MDKPAISNLLKAGGAILGIGLGLVLLARLSAQALWIVILLIVALGLQLAWGRRPSRDWFHKRSFQTDLTFLAIHLIGWTPYLTLLFSFGIAWIGVRFLAQFQIYNGPSRHPIVAIVIYYVLFTFVDYWNHRLFHTRWGWFFHRTHHSATEFSPLLTFRNHPMQVAIEYFTRPWPLLFVGLSPRALVITGLINTFFVMLIHMDVDWNWGWFGRWVLLSPRGHKIHHSPLPEHENKNLSLLVIWDRLFGTWYASDVQNETVGISEPIHNRRFLGSELLVDVRDCLNFSRLRLLPGK
jgi:sterol desaturase/sphingolipid hydroxylase (fatty acid hydroxylase superfamily)